MTETPSSKTFQEGLTYLNAVRHTETIRERIQQLQKGMAPNIPDTVRIKAAQAIMNAHQCARNNYDRCSAHHEERWNLTLNVCWGALEDADTALEASTAHNTWEHITTIAHAIFETDTAFARINWPHTTTPKHIPNWDTMCTCDLNGIGADCTCPTTQDGTRYNYLAFALAALDAMQEMGSDGRANGRF